SGRGPSPPRSPRGRHRRSSRAGRRPGRAWYSARDSPPQSRRRGTVWVGPPRRRAPRRAREGQRHSGARWARTARPERIDRVSMLPERANQTTPEQPWPVRLLSAKIADYIDKMSPVWIEGQIVQLNRRPGASMAFLTLRDTDADTSLPV